jgi:phosphohistidine phosphatase
VPRRLVLIRHAEAAPAASDADRPLTDRGLQQAAALGRWLQRGGLAPDRAVVSRARRAAETWERAAARMTAPPAPIVDARIYDNTVEALLTVLAETPSETGIVALVGHNPSIGTLASVLDDGAGSPSARRDLQAGFPTGCVAVFGLELPFDAVTPGIATLEACAVPHA